MEVYGKRRKHGQEDIKALVQRWRDIYNDESLDYKEEQSTTFEVIITMSMQSIMAAMPEPAISFISAPSAAFKAAFL